MLDGVGVVSGSALADDGVEAVEVIGRVVDGAHGTVRLDQAVLAMHDVTVPRLCLVLDVARVMIRHAIAELVFRNRLETEL